VINICCQHIIAEFTDIELGDELTSFAPSAPHTDVEVQDFTAAVKRDPIALGRVVVRTIRASGQRRAKFTEVIQHGNLTKHFFLGDRVEIIVPDLQLIHDVRTRWDSIYFMIRRLRVLRPVCHWVMLIHLFYADDQCDRLLITFWPCL
jgi:hypothetical protein